MLRGTANKTANEGSRVSLKGASFEILMFGNR